MQRRDVLKVLGAAVAGWPVAALAQSTMPVIGFLNAATREGYERQLVAFLEGLGESGYVEGRNVAIEYRWAEGQYNRLPPLTADLLGRKVAAIAVTGSTAAAQATSAATQTIPIVFVIGADPVKFSLVASLNRPGGNVTGVSFLVNLLGAKQFGLLHELIPAATIFGFLINPNNPNAESDTNNARLAVDALGRKIIVVSARTSEDFDHAFGLLTQGRANALLIGADPLFSGSRDQLAALAARYTLPAIFNSREFALVGGLLSYGPDQADAYHQAGIYIGRILNGEKPSDLPVVQPTKFEFVINIKTAKALGLTVPPTLLARADEVIE